jgi:hypothetical protein
MKAARSARQSTGENMDAFLREMFWRLEQAAIKSMDLSRERCERMTTAF